NVLRVLNRELGATFDPDAFAHIARFDTTAEWIEMHLESSGDQAVAVSDLGLEVGFAAGERMRTEISAKFTRQRVERDLDAAGLEPAAWWTDGAGDFGLALVRQA